MGRLPFKGKLLVTDMDGTLLDSGSRISKKNKEAIAGFIDGGGLFTVATGRVERSVRSYLSDISLNVPAILYNGAVIYDFESGKLLWRDDLPEEVIEPVKLIIERFPGIGAQIYNGGKTYFVRQNEHTLEHMAREHYIPVIAEIEEIPRPWHKVLLSWDPGKLRKVEEFLKDFSGLFRYTYSEPQFLEILNNTASKGGALKVLTRISGISDFCVIAMGDNLNDLELIKEADIGIAVENAHSALKDAADICCGHHDRDAVSEVIKWIEEGKIVC